MNARDWKEVGVWAAVTIVISVGLLGGTTAFSERGKVRPTQPSTVIGDVVITASAAMIDENKIEVTINAATPTGKIQKVVVPVSVISREFTGNAMSRVMRPEDFVNTTLYTQKPTINVPAEGSNTLTLQFDTRAPVEAIPVFDNRPVTELLKSDKPLLKLAKPDEKPRMLTYSIQIEGDKAPLSVPVSRGKAAGIAE